MELAERARVFATAAHAAVKQVRKYTNEPYIVHPQEVANIVASRPHSQEMIAAAWLHDVVEDTGVTNKDITQEFGNKVGEYVGWLTKISRPEHGNRAFRMQMDRNYIADAPVEVKTVKIADLISNSESIMKHDEKFGRVYFNEARLMLEVLIEGDLVLFERAQRIVGK